MLVILWGFVKGSQRNSVEMRDFVRPSPKRSTERLSYELRRDEEDEENEDDLFGLSAVQKVNNSSRKIPL